VLAGCAALLPVGPIRADQGAQVDNDVTLHVPAFVLPESSLRKQTSAAQLPSAAPLETCPRIQDASPSEAPAIRKCERRVFQASAYYRRLREPFAVTSVQKEIGGVHTEVFVPTGGVPASNRKRVLIDLHGGAFLGGWGINSESESVPLAALGHIEVVSVDYRHAPEHRCPVASDDVTAVYRQLLETYKPENIGIYGCSAGALLAAEALARFQKENLPLPGAVVMLSGGASYWSDGDSGYFGRAVYGDDLVFDSAARNPYFKEVPASDALAFPVRSAAILGRFPPSLLISGTRDFALSSVVHTHSVLVERGVEAELHVWEGVGHAFFYDLDLPESRAAYHVLTRFFDTHLGVQPGERKRPQ
jgi:acetyl esterase/lipase